MPDHTKRPLSQSNQTRRDVLSIQFNGSFDQESAENQDCGEAGLQDGVCLLKPAYFVPGQANFQGNLLGVLA